MRFRGSTAVVEVSGDVDISTAPCLDACLKQLISAGQRELAVDLENCSYIDSEGLKTLIGALRSLGSDGQIVICAARGGVSRVLQISGLTTLFSILPSVEDLGLK